ncbi:hypothetical protein [Paenibacillus apiarius]|uniref:Uncharacterized protein n=1 Tax=Paenibacillus apiarius TaxID=46240 RepID=A0ABT4DRQ2_9BACL|nr:hypothetical protein [Paenibacillus apiarius]MCY9516682.1 hypothetical protein [Paenibacillus apiarius]MCY9519920.1 hypothetical protein [Paenibacillus apiarius]MCY9553842.1 hypothetical protein [Paenibacillus apiarius]MCY9557550.1 hypothetical protein [Paenibacillus apiarius]MCY9685510.1 hypothetical protein [Paenibacillus apiarius]
MRKWGFVGALLAMLILISGCGGPKADITVFMMPKSTVPSEMTQALKEELSKQFQGKFTVDAVASPMYNLQKLIVEYAAGDNGIVMLPEDDVKTMAMQGGHVVLDNYFDKEKYAAGVMDGVVYEKAEKGYNEYKGKHLYALPADQMPLLKKLGIQEPGLFVTIPARTPNEELSVEVLKALAEEQ